jgi:5-(carboxyamino)imidazole ribonucleotide mutase
MRTKVAIIMGSESDFKSMKDATEVLEQFGISYSVQVVSAHRTPEAMVTFAKAAKRKGVEVIIAGAGGAAHLPGMVASLTTLPVIGVPIMTGRIRGLDSLLSIAQMPKGVPVATMAVDNSYNAALFAVRILSTRKKSLAAQLQKFQKKQKAKVAHMNQNLKKQLS